MGKGKREERAVLTAMSFGTKKGREGEGKKSLETFSWFVLGQFIARQFSCLNYGTSANFGDKGFQNGYNLLNATRLYYATGG